MMWLLIVFEDLQVSNQQIQNILCDQDYFQSSAYLSKVLLLMLKVPLQNNHLKMYFKNVIYTKMQYKSKMKCRYLFISHLYCRIA